MNKPLQVYKLLREHPAGVTAQTDGRVFKRRHGFIVSITDNQTPKITLDAVRQLLKKADQLNNKGLLVGSWYDPEKRIYCLDLNLCLDDEQDARVLGRVFGQRAIYDLKTQSVITI